jgi:hypothetical protein
MAAMDGRKGVVIFQVPAGVKKGGIHFFKGDKFHLAGVTGDGCRQFKTIAADSPKGRE